MRTGALLVGAVGLLAASATAAASPGSVPRWLTVNDTRRPPVVPIPTIAPARLAALRQDQHAFVERLRRFELELRPDGTVDERMTFARQFLDEQGVREAGTLSVSVRAASTRLTIEEAYVIAPDGERRPFDPRILQIVTGDDGSLFSDRQNVVLPFADLSPGATAVIVVRRRHEAGRWPLPWSEIFVTQGATPTERFEVLVSWPLNRPPPAWRTDDASLDCHASADRLSCTRLEIPPIQSDSDLVSWVDLQPHLVLSAERSWQVLADIEARILASRETPRADARKEGSLASRETPRADAREEGSLDGDGGDVPAAVKMAAARITDGAETDERRIERLFRFVADEVRYVGLEHGDGAVVPRPPEVTLRRKFGDCKDKVALLLALARAVGLVAHPVLVATDRRDPAKLLLPSWKYFDHVIACIDAEGGTRCMDPTDPDLPAGTLDYAVQNAVALPLKKGAQPGHLPRPERYGWIIDVETLNEVACDGSVKETVTRHHRGASAGRLRGRLRAQNAAERRRWQEEDYQIVMGDHTEPTVEVRGLEDSAAPLVLRTVTSYPGQSPATSWNDWVEPDHWLQHVGNGFKTENRHHPYTTSGLTVRSRVEYVFCPQVVPKLTGATLDFPSPFGKLSRTYAISGQRGTVDTTLTLEPQTVALAEQPRFNRFIATVLDQSRIWFGLEQAARATSAPKAMPGTSR